MAVNWTKEQKQVIESRNRNLLVSAAAGSGKTAVLVERIIQMITDEEHPVEIDRLLVMTFTRAAAAEMRERIQEAIEKKLEEHPENEHLQRQAVMVQFAQITTIDSFCLHILREHFDRLDIDPAFRVGDEGEMLLMRTDVMREMLEEYYEKGGERYEAFVDTYAVGKADGGIDDAILQVYAFAQSNPWPEKWLAHCREELNSTTLAELNQTEWMQFLLKDAAMQAEEWSRQLSGALELCREEDGPEPYLSTIAEDLSQVNRILENTDSYEAFSRAVEGISFSRLTAIRGKNSSVSPEKKEKAADCRKRVKKAVERLREEYLFTSPEQALSDMEAGRDRILMLLELAEEFSRRFQEKKKEKAVVDFNDLEHFALEVLTVPCSDEMEKEAGREEMGGAKKKRRAACLDRRPGPAADELSRQFDEILVDEYQDSNLVQETLIQCISRERFGHPNVFMVGDVKQSIYKFRLARPELFLEKYHSYPAEAGDFQKIELHRNFRSRSEVLDSINDVFYRIMTQKLGGIAYTEETALHAGAVFEEREGLEELKTELLLIDTSADTLKELDEDISDYTSRELEAGMIAGRIQRLVDRESGLTVWDKEEKRYRRAEYRDIVILLRSVSGWAESFCEVLERQGIPAMAESRTGYFTAIEVETVLNLLSVIDNPIQDIPLAAVLKSPIGNITDQELAHITAFCKAGCRRERQKGIYWAVKQYLEPEESHTEDSAREPGQERDTQEESGWPGLKGRLCALLDLISRLRAMAVYLPMHELLYRIYDKTGYYSYVSAMPGGEARRANLDMLVEKAAAYESTSYRGVFHFIRYIEKLKKYNTDFGEAGALAGQGNTVRIMSIHKSKGLEFPIVFVAAMAKQFNRQDTRGALLIDADLGIATDYLDRERRLKGPTLKKNVMKRRMELEALGEELRVLYVAMTRAKEKLILTASCRNPAERMEKWSRISFEDGRVPCTVLTLAASCLDWVLMSMNEHTVRIEVREERAADQLEREIGEQLYRRASLKELFDKTEETVYDESYRTLLMESFRFRYPHEADMVLNTKMSVSELKKAGIEEEAEEMVFLPTLPAFMEEREKEEGGTTRGNAYHRFMELLPLEELAPAGSSGEEEARAGSSGEKAAPAGSLAGEATRVGSSGEEAAPAGSLAGEATRAGSLAEKAAPAGNSNEKREENEARTTGGKPFAGDTGRLRSWIRSCLDRMTESRKMTAEDAAFIHPSDIERFLKTDLGRRVILAAAAGRLRREKQFVMGIPAREMGDWDSDELVLIQGIIDAFFEEDGKLVLVDYKTDYAEQEDILKKRYHAQLDYYERALVQMTGKQVKERYIYSYRLGEIRV